LNDNEQFAAQSLKNAYDILNENKQCYISASSVFITRGVRTTLRLLHQ